MKYLKLFEYYNLSNPKETILNSCYKGKYLFHLTFKGNVKSILKKGLIPRFKPNQSYDSGHYKHGFNGVFLTQNVSPDNINLPYKLSVHRRHLVVLQIDITNLDFDFFRPDDDFHFQNTKISEWTPEWMKLQAEEYQKLSIEQKAAMSLKKWGTLVYEGIIPPEFVTILKE